MKKKGYSAKKYWLLLPLWFLFLFLAASTLEPKTAFPAIAVFLLLYALLLALLHVYQWYQIDGYLQKHYPWEAKQHRSDSFPRTEKDLIFSFSPEGDEEWKALKSFYKEFLLAMVASLGAAFFSSALYLIIVSL